MYTNTTEFQKHDAIRNYLEENEGLNIDFEKDALLYFTDNINEPRKINIYRALLEKMMHLQVANTQMVMSLSLQILYVHALRFLLKELLLFLMPMRKDLQITLLLHLDSSLHINTYIKIKQRVLYPCIQRPHFHRLL